MTPYPVPQQNWFARNWKWFVPTGCLTLLVLFFAFLAGILGLVETFVRSSDAYREALTRARADPRVVDKIGQPLHPGWFVSGSVNVSGESGDADISIPISGPKGKGKIYVSAKKIAGQWRFETLQVEVAGQSDRIDLLQASNPANLTKPHRFFPWGLKLTTG
jgi:hypothetical protein